MSSQCLCMLVAACWIAVAGKAHSLGGIPAAQLLNLYQVEPALPCLNGDAAKFYYRNCSANWDRKPGFPDFCNVTQVRWIITFDSSSPACYSDESCQAMPPNATGSSHLPATVFPDGSLLPYAEANPNLYKAHSVLVPACSGDLFSGSAGSKGEIGQDKQHDSKAGASIRGADRQAAGEHASRTNRALAPRGRTLSTATPTPHRGWDITVAVLRQLLIPNPPHWPRGKTLSDADDVVIAGPAGVMSGLRAVADLIRSEAPKHRTRPGGPPLVRGLCDECLIQDAQPLAAPRVGDPPLPAGTSHRASAAVGDEAGGRGDGTRRSSGPIAPSLSSSSSSSSSTSTSTSTSTSCRTPFDCPWGQMARLAAREQRWPASGKGEDVLADRVAGALHDAAKEGNGGDGFGNGTAAAVHTLVRSALFDQRQLGRLIPGPWPPLQPNATLPNPAMVDPVSVGQQAASGVDSKDRGDSVGGQIQDQRQFIANFAASVRRTARMASNYTFTSSCSGPAWGAVSREFYTQLVYDELEGFMHQEAMSVALPSFLDATARGGPGPAIFGTFNDSCGGFLCNPSQCGGTL